MLLLFQFTLPIKDQVLIFALLLFIILLSPFLLRRLRVPSIVGLILAGVLVGPKGLGVLELDAAIKLFGTVGLLYIMFLAGLEIDFRDFQRNRNKSLVYGFLTFSIPLSIGTVTTFYYLGFPMQSSLLLASMYATHTLISYPIVSRMGITRNEAVTITVGGTILTDTAALLLLSVISEAAKGELTVFFWCKMLIGLSLFIGAVMWLLPIIGRWFFSKVESEGQSQYIFTLSTVFGSAFLAELAGVEPIIGAFLAGLAMNRLVPHASPLMNRISFVGNAIFIPFFLIRVGMIVDVRVLFGDFRALNIAATIVIVAYATKWLAAYFTQKIFRYTRVQRQMIFGLGSSHAAATLAIILIGYDLKLFDDAVMNGTILMILVTCVGGTFITERAAKKIVALENEEKPIGESEITERILVPMANPASFGQLLDLAILLKKNDSEVPIYPLSVVNDDDQARKNVLLNSKRFNTAIQHAAAADTKIEIVTRVDLSPSGGIVRAAKELMITDIIIGWNGKSTAVEQFFGSIMTQVLQHTDQTVIVSKVNQALNTFQRIELIVPENAELETGFSHWIDLIARLLQQTGASLNVHAFSANGTALQDTFKAKKPRINATFQPFESWDNLENMRQKMKENTLLIVVEAREQSVSFNRNMERIPRMLSANFEDKNFLMLYPAR